MKLEYTDIIDKHKGSKCVIVAHGPSLNEYIDKLPKYKKDGHVIIGCNNWNEFYEKTPPHYWVNVNTIDTIKSMKTLINKYECVFLYADSVDLTDKKWIDENIISNYLNYDQRHFGGKPCFDCRKHGCSKTFNANRLTIQEELQKYTNHHSHYSPGDTVTLHMMAFAVLMGCTEIYIIGADLNYKLGYAHNSTNRNPIDSFDDFYERILDDMKLILDSCKDTINIYNTNVNTTWDLFPIKQI
jgi:hypothetical protein